MVQLVSTPPCHGGGRGFESLRSRFNKLQVIRGVSSAGRASALQAGGHRFEPCTPHLHADVAQLAEQLICNQQVNGSSPFIGFLQFIIWMGSRVANAFDAHAQLAQLVEQWTENPRVSGSIPELGTIGNP